MEKEIIAQINAALKEFFNNPSHSTVVSEKKIMEFFFEKKIFKRENRAARPVRKLLRRLEAENRLDEIPYAFGVRKKGDTIATDWYFTSGNAKELAAFLNE